MSGEPPFQVIVSVPPTIRTVTVALNSATSVVATLSAPVNMVSASTETVTVEELGIVGPQGPPGPSGAEPQAYSLVNVSSWSHTHAFGYLPEVRLVDAGGEVVLIGVEYPTSSTILLTFPSPFTGTVYLS